MALRKAKEKTRRWGHIQSVIRRVIAQLVYAIVGEVQLPVGIPVEAHCVTYAWKEHLMISGNDFAPCVPCKHWRVRSQEEEILKASHANMCG